MVRKFNKRLILGLIGYFYDQHLKNMDQDNFGSQEPQRAVTIERVFEAPRQRVFGAWLDPKQLSQWWGPKGFTNPAAEIDPRPDGHIRIDMKGPDGTTYPMTGVFLKIEPAEKLAFTSNALFEANGNPRLENRNTVTFQDFDGKTIITLRAAVVRSTPEAVAALAGMEQGWNESFDKLAEVLK